MSILDGGEIRGRVVLVLNYFPTQKKTVIIHRPAVVSVEIVSGPALECICGNNVLRIDPIGRPYLETCERILSSILTEDVDVVWTITREGATRVPDLEPGLPK